MITTIYSIADRLLTSQALGYARQVWWIGLGVIAVTEKTSRHWFKSLVQEGEAVTAQARQQADMTATRWKAQGTVVPSIITWQQRLETNIQPYALYARHGLDKLGDQGGTGPVSPVSIPT